MTINKVANGKDLTISLAGRLDTTTAPQLDDELKGSLAGVENHFPHWWWFKGTIPYLCRL